MVRQLWDRLAALVAAAASVACVALVLGIGVALLLKAWPIVASHHLGRLLLSSSWRPAAGEFGFYPFLVGTMWVSGLAMAVSIPVSLLTALGLAEYAPARLRFFAKPVLDLLAAIPSVVFGLWGVLALVPLVRKLGASVGSPTTGYSVLAGGAVLAIMVLPFTIAVMQAVLRKVPLEAREASFALGATKWQTTKHVVLRAAYPGMLSAVVLGFSRAFGETMAVLMVVGNVPAVPRSVLDPAYPLPALIANNYGEMMSVPLYDSALMFAALILLAAVVIFNITAVTVLRGLDRRLA